MKKLYFISAGLFVLLIIVYSCVKKDVPAPINYNSIQPVTVIANPLDTSYSLGGTFYNTSLAGESTLHNGSNYYYIMSVSDNAGNTFCEFWFIGGNKPSPGTYNVVSWLSGYNNGLGAQQVGVRATTGVKTSQYYSQNYASATTLTLTTHGANTDIAISNLPLENSSNASDIKNLTTALPIP
jgi:hypothetical protein